MKNSKESLGKRNNSLSLRLVLLVVSIFVAFCAAVLSSAGILLLPVLAATCAILFVLDREGKRIFTLLLPILAISVDCVINSYYSFVCLISVICGALIAVWFLKRDKKAMFLAIITVIILALVLSLIYLGVAFEIKSFDVTTVSDTIRDFVTELRLTLIEQFNSLYSLDAQGNAAPLLSPDVVTELVDLYFSILPAIFAVASLVLAALSFLLFSIFGKRALGFDGSDATLVFKIHSVFAYFYLVLSFLQMFETGSDVFSVAITNLYYVFLFVFAYVGFRFSNYLLAKRLRSPALSFILVAIATVMLSPFSIQLLSLLGTVESVAVTKFGDRGNKNNDLGGA